MLGENIEVQTIRCTTTFSDLPKVPQQVRIVHNVREAPAFGERFTSQPAPTRVMQSVTIEGTGIDDEVMHRVANLLPTLAQVAFAACQPGLDHEVRSLGASRVGKEVVRTADVYAAAVADRRSPLQAVMDELSLSKATASRRIRAAKDAGLLPERASEL